MENNVELYKINVIGTGSEGNAYELSFTDGHKIALDAGLKYEHPEQINQLFISHLHLDHSKYIKQFDNINIEKVLPDSDKDSGDNWRRFPIKHIVKNWGYEINYGKEKIVYMTDIGCWYDISETFPTATYLFVECNFDAFRVEAGLLEAQSYSSYAFSLEGHSSNLDCLNLIASLKIPPTCKIVLVHKSKQHSCKETFKMFDSLPNKIAVAEDKQIIMCKSWKII